jgi:hypothetical protein
MDDMEKKLKLLRDMEKLKAAPIKAPGYTSPLDQDVIKVAGGGPAPKDVVQKFKGATEKIDTNSALKTISGSDFKSKIQALLKSNAGKKMIGALPMIGAGMAALQGDPAMAADELAGDIPVVGQAYEAARPDVAGESSGDERQMLAELKAQQNYDKSPARLAKIKAMMGKPQ